MLVLKTQICSSGTDIKWNDLCIMQISCLLSMASSEGNTHLVESNFEATHNTHTCTHLKAVTHISAHCLGKPHQRKVLTALLRANLFTVVSVDFLAI